MDKTHDKFLADLAVLCQKYDMFFEADGDKVKVIFGSSKLPTIPDLLAAQAQWMFGEQDQELDTVGHFINEEKNHEIKVLYRQSRGTYKVEHYRDGVKLGEYDGLSLDEAKLKFALVWKRGDYESIIRWEVFTVTELQTFFRP